MDVEAEYIEEGQILRIESVEETNAWIESSINGEDLYYLREMDRTIYE